MLEDHLKKTQDKLGTTQVESNNFFSFWFKDLGKIIVDLLQKLCNASKNEIETEEQMKMLNEHEIDRLKQDILQMENKITNIKDRKSTLAVRQRRIKYILNPYMSKLKVEVNYSGESRGRSRRVRVGVKVRGGGGKGMKKGRGRKHRRASVIPSPPHPSRS